MTVYKVDGMACEGCARSVSAAIRAAAGDVAVSVDLAAGTVSVEGVDDEALIATAVDDAGFRFAGRA